MMNKGKATFRLPTVRNRHSVAHRKSYQDEKGARDLSRAVRPGSRALRSQP